MDKVTTFLGSSDAGIFAYGLFVPMAKTAHVGLGEWETADEIRQYIKTITPEDRKKYCYVLVNALGAGEYFGCFPAGAMVRTRNGDRPIEQVKEGEYVLTHQNRWRRVLAAKPKQQLDGLTHVNIGGVPKEVPGLTATPNHEVYFVPRDELLRKRKRLYYKRGAEEDRDRSYVRFVSSLRPDWLPVAHLRAGDFIFQPFPTEESNGDFQRRWGSDDFAFLMGLYTAEGCLAKRYDETRPSRASGEDWYEKVILVLGGSEGLVAEKVREVAAKHNHSAYITTNPETNSIRVELCWKELAQACLAGIGHHATEKSLSSDIICMPRGWQQVFLNAYAGGDGHIAGDAIWRSRESLTLTTASKRLAMGVRLMFARLGVPAAVNGRHNDKSTWYNGNPIYTVCVGGSWRREDGRKAAESFIDAERGFLISPVKEVWSEPSWQGQVFDLCVEEDSSYVVNGVVVHNSNINADYFPWDALAHEGDDYGYKTFLNAHCYTHHVNKDPERSIGKPVVAVLNPRMKRVELIIRIDREAARKQGADGVVARIDNGEFPDCSMGCKVPYDICMVCGNHSKTRDDYCEHLRPPEHLKGIFGPNKILSTGQKCCVSNTLPRFFDISFVFIGADKTAKAMAKLATRGAHVCLGPVCTLPAGPGVEGPSLYGPTGYALDVGSMRKTASVSCDGRRGPCGRLCSECSERDTCETEKLASAFGVKQAAKHKLSEIKKNIQVGTFATKKLPPLEAAEPDFQRSVLERMAKRPLCEACGATTALGMVLKPHEFQRLVLMRMGHAGMADDMERERIVFRQGNDFDYSIKPVFGPDPDLIKALAPYVSDRSAFGPALTLRVIKLANAGEAKKTLPTRDAVEHPLLDKISAAYNGYRRNVMLKLSQAQEEVVGDPQLRNAILGDELVMAFSKTASSHPLLTSDSAAYMMGAHLSNRSLLASTRDAVQIAVANPELSQLLA